ncbi:late competence development ComFB family protein [Piscinibacter sp. HJYY11]|uniref:late competence development ComFB family protein n=1 Tax=Piscinibacter sp. HJYY11 TaxID=2801333 RepID=UPI00191EAFA1|nr:late competence development ComFB family protein [Piscinibacter sp. HJYY11]MBL0731159.1 late competence development ComFB family protein [Piscinibacter sp. HJYY11]
MSAADFESIHNHYERIIFEAVLASSAKYQVPRDQLADVACVALNRLPPRYVRHDVDLVFYLTENERAHNEVAIAEAVKYAFEFVQARSAMKARA